MWHLCLDSRKDQEDRETIIEGRASLFHLIVFLLFYLSICYFLNHRLHMPTVFRVKFCNIPRKRTQLCLQPTLIIFTHALALEPVRFPPLPTRRIRKWVTHSVISSLTYSLARKPWQRAPALLLCCLTLGELPWPQWGSPRFIGLEARAQALLQTLEEHCSQMRR